MSFDENDLMNRDYLAERHQKLVNELEILCHKLPSIHKQKVNAEFLSELANSLLDKTVFDIVKNLKDIQDMTENNLLERRMKLVRTYKAARTKMLSRHEGALANEYRINNRNADILRLRQRNELQEFDKCHEEELNQEDMRVIMELDQTVSDQQITLERVGVPGFFVSNKPADVKLQMHLLEFISILSKRDSETS